MTQDNQNPLAQFYRKEKLFVTLPSKGAYYSEKIIDMPDDGELGIKPMTAADEILLKNPDALLTGRAVSDVIKSCVPAVKQPRKLLACDVDTLLISIRRASYGDTTELKSVCPNCNEENVYDLDLDTVLTNADPLESSYEVILPEGLTVFLQPGTFETLTKQSKALFENAKVQRALANPAITDEASLAMLSSAFSKMSQINFDLVADAIVKIVFTDGEGQEHVITSKKHIGEFIANVEKKEIDMIDEKIAEINKVGIKRDMSVQCIHCEHKWEAPIEFNPVNFS